MATPLLAVALQAAAQEFELAPVGGPIHRDSRGKSAEILVGLMAGSDSNPARAASDETGDTVGEAFAGLMASGGNTHLGYHLAAETRLVRFADLDDLDYEEGRVNAHANWSSQRFLFGIDARLALMADPIDVETLPFGILKREALSYAPEISLVSGRTELGISYRAESMTHAAAAFRHLDRQDATAELELCRRSERDGRCFVRVSSGVVDYDVYDPATPRYDFSRQMACVGLLVSTPRESAFELAAGAERVESEDFGDEQGLYASARATCMFGRRNAALEASYVRRVEPSATADFKTASRALLRYTRNVSTRLRWTASLASETSEFTNPDAPSDDSLYVLRADLGVERILGSPAGWQGRFDITVGSEKSDTHERLRVLAGIVLSR